MQEPQVVILVADGVRPDTLAGAIARGELPALQALRDGGGQHEIVTCFPSISMAGYAPMLTGRHPARVGLPGLRWFDRARGVSRLLGHSRSYVGPAIRSLNSDLAQGIPTMWELLPGESSGMFAAITRGLPRERRLDRGARLAARATWHHVRGNAAGWLALDRELGARLAREIRRRKPRFTFAVFPSCDKASHAAGHDSPLVLDALRTVDNAAGTIRRDAERDGRWQNLHLWLVSDHGHAPVSRHEDIADLVRCTGYRVCAHPWAVATGADVAVMVSGNAMAHLYVELERRTPPAWHELGGRWEPLLERLLLSPSVDFAAVRHDTSEVEIRARGRGTAHLLRKAGAFSYRPIDGDPIGLGTVEDVEPEEALARSMETDYPDAPAQLVELLGGNRSGDIVISAASGWDFRSRYEPMLHRSAHGGLHSSHMRVPLLLDRRPTMRPQRTADLFPSALEALGLELPPGLDGRSFLQ